jgi:hypothetical protein
VAGGVGLEFKPQYHKKRKRKKKILEFKPQHSKKKKKATWIHYKTMCLLAKE